MRIGMLADVYQTHISGVTNYIATNKRALESVGHEVHVFTFGSQADTDIDPFVHYSPGLPLVDTGYYFGFQYSRQVKSLLQTMDVVHVHHPFISGRLALRYCHPIRIPVVFTNHTRYDLYLQAYLPMMPEGLGGTFLQAYLVGFCREVDLVISPSAGMADVLRKLGVDAPVKIIPNGVDLHHYKPIQPKVGRGEFGFLPDHVIFIYVGRLAPEKNLHFLLQAFHGVVEAYPHARLLLVGDGPERESLEAQAAQNGTSACVIFAGAVPHELVPDYLTLGDCFVTASITEVHPLSIIEAMASGLPILGINSPGVADIVKDGETGLLSQNYLAAFTAKMARMTTDFEMRFRMKAAACWAAEEYTIERTSQVMIEEYQSLAQNANPRQNGSGYVQRSSDERWRKY